MNWKKQFLHTLTKKIGTTQLKTNSFRDKRWLITLISNKIKVNIKIDLYFTMTLLLMNTVVNSRLRLFSSFDRNIMVSLRVARWEKDHISNGLLTYLNLFWGLFYCISACPMVCDGWYFLILFLFQYFVLFLFLLFY